MGLRSLKHEILNEVDINNVLRKFTKKEIALIFNVHPDYVDKVRISQKIVSDELFKRRTYLNSSDEMKLGSVGDWSNSKERNFMAQNFLLEAQNGKS